MTIRQKIADFVTYTRTLRELQALDNRQLADIGVNRSDIRAVARAAV